MRQTNLITFVGNHDPFGDAEGSLGPVLSLLNERCYDRVYLIWTGTDYLEKAKTIEEEMRDSEDKIRFYYLPFELESVIDYEEIFGKLKTLVKNITAKADLTDSEYSVLLDPGTPQMQTSWLLLVKAGILKAKLLQGVPAKFTGGRYLVREVDYNSKVLPEIKMADEFAPEGNETRTLFQAAAVPPPARPVAQRPVISEDSSLNAVYRKADLAAGYDDVPVLIEGETGTGKEVLACYIHENSERAKKPFAAVNCAGIPRDLAESTFFGHVKGAFTGADAGRQGYLRAVDGGTLFLDEIGELPLDIQSKLLRAIETGEFQPVGSDKTVKVNIRYISATNRNLLDMIETSGFRDDLYQRIAVIKLTIPPLRERETDIPLLVQHFKTEWMNKYKLTRHLSAEALALLCEYPWPRNVREVRTVVTNMCCLTHNDEVTVENLPDEVLEFFNRKKPHSDLLIPLSDAGIDLRAMLNGIEARYYREAMDRTGGNAAEAAKLLGITPAAFRKALRERIDIGV